MGFGFVVVVMVCVVFVVVGEIVDTLGEFFCGLSSAASPSEHQNTENETRGRICVGYSSLYNKIVDIVTVGEFLLRHCQENL